MYVIKQPLHAAPVTDSEANVLAEWNALYDAYNEVACFMLGSMTLELHRIFENYSPYEMLQELKSMFEKQVRVERKRIDELHAILIEYEKGLPKKAETPQVMMIKGGKIQKSNKKSHKAKGKGKANGKRKDKPVYNPKPKNPKPAAKEHPSKDDTCHHCKEVGHWKRNCPIYFAELLKKKKQVGSASSSGVILPSIRQATSLYASYSAFYSASTFAVESTTGATEDGKPVAAYVLQMKGYVDQLERLGYMLPQDIIKSNKKSLKAKGKGKANSKRNDKQVYIPKPKNPKHAAKENPTKDDTCHHYKEMGHCKKNCPIYLAELLKKKKQVGSASSSALKEPNITWTLLIYGIVVLLI
nr:hypothetical protein [Tanacetum cinerariifolium]